MSISEHARADPPKSSPTVLRPRRLVGRDVEIRDVSESVTSAPVTTLLGPGGVGKTALAITVAAACSRDFPGGVTVVWLGSLRSAELVAAEVAAQLGLPRSVDSTPMEALPRLRACLSGECDTRKAMTHWASHPFTLRQLQYVLAVAEHLNFRRAAEACAIAQPSLSTQVAQVEAALAITLFERLPRGVVVTAAGQKVIERARRLLLDADDLVATAAGTRDPFAATLRVGVIPTVAPYLLPELAPVLHAKYPRLKLLWIEEKTRDLIVRIGSGELDAGIVAVESDLGDLEHEPLGRDAFFLTLPKGHRLAQSKAPARIEELEGETVLLLDDGHCFRDQALAVCQRAAADEASMRATSLSTLAQMVAGGAAITLLPRISLKMENRARALVARPFGPRGPYRTLALAWRKTAPSVGVLRALAQTMRGVVGPGE